MRIKMLRADKYQHAPAKVTVFPDGWSGTTTRTMGEALVAKGSAEEIKGKSKRPARKPKKDDTPPIDAADAIESDNG